MDLPSILNNGTALQTFIAWKSITKQGIEIVHWTPSPACLPPYSCLYKLNPKVVTYFLFQLNSENQPTDQLDRLALSILQEIGSTATTGNA